MAKLSKIVIATLNRHKVREIQGWFAPYGLEILALADYTGQMPPETGETFAENALLKARYGHEVTGLPALADDSGLEVDALGGRPGVYSARYAGEDASDGDNNRKLLLELKNAQDRTARFRCSMALVTGGEIVQADGTCAGLILEEPKGKGGFGYDPLFWLPELDRSMAELSEEQKNAISHRGRALANLVDKLKGRGLI